MAKKKLENSVNKKEAEKKEIVLEDTLLNSQKKKVKGYSKKDLAEFRKVILAKKK